ncbi:MAG: hypothetical protein HKN09_00665, partial [Saprospiraceae bacterium]|nr:hypothetical protein [Saprospiraceae bacterium]
MSGKVLDDNSGNPIPNLEIKINDQIVFSDADGKFYYQADAIGSQTIIIESNSFNSYTLDVSIEDESNINLGIIFLSRKETVTRTFDDNYLIDQRQLDNFEIDGQQVSSLLSAAWDPFGSLADYNFSVTRFNPRGLAQNHSQIYLNNLPFNNLGDGRYFWSLWGGLNDVLRVRYSQYGLNSTDFSVGGMSGALDIDMRAASQRAQTRLTYSISNRTYTNRAMLTHSSGLSQSGWSYSFSVSKRWGNAGYIEGTYYDAYSYFASIDKKINDKHSLNFVAFAAPTIRGRGSSSTAEMYEVLDDNFYNPNWGFQNGKVRNSREYRTHQPVAMMRHDWQLNDNSRITTTIGVQTGHFGSTRLDWLEAADPRPDYYRNLPYASINNPVAAEAIAEELRSNVMARQINFDELIAVNQQRQYLVRDPNGNSANNYLENISAYIIVEQWFDNRKIAFQSHINHQFKDNLAFNAGIQIQYDRNHQYKILDDLLGGSFYLDIDDFALRDFPDDYSIVQNDISQPNRLLQEGDVFGYNHY